VLGDGRLEQLALVTADAGKAHGVLVVAVRRALRAAGSSTAATSRSCPTVPFKQGGSLTDHVAVVRSFRATTVCISRDDRPARAPRAPRSAPRAAPACWLGAHTQGFRLFATNAHEGGRPNRPWASCDMYDHDEDDEFANALRQAPQS